MEQDDLVDTGFDAYNLRALAVLSGLVAVMSWFVVMLLVLDDDPHRLLRLWLEVLATTATIASAALAVCATVKGSEQRILAAIRDDRP